MPTRHSYAQLLETNSWIRKASDISYWLCQTRTTQESKLFPVPAYMLVSYLNSFYRYPELLRKIEAAMPAEEIGDRARETCSTVSNISVGWCLDNFYLLGREYLLSMGLLKTTDAVDDVVFVMDFWKRFMLSYHRSDAHVTNGDFGNRSQIRSERHLQVFEADAYACAPGDRLHAAVTGYLATTSQYQFLSHCECRLGIHNEGPYRVGDRQLFVRDFVNMGEGDFPWLDGVARDIPYSNLTIPVLMKDTEFTIMDDWVSFETKPKYEAENITAVGLYTADVLSDGYTPVAMGSAAELAEYFEHLREVVQHATAELWKVIAGWSRDQMLDAGALVYFASVRDLAHIAGVYDQDDWFTIDERAQRFKPLMNDEYGRDGLTELVGLVSLPAQQSHEYVMARFSDSNRNMESLIPYSVLTDGEFTATAGPMRPGSTSLPPKTGSWNTSRGMLTQDEFNAAARGPASPLLQEPYRFLDDQWVKSHHTSSRADELYRLTQRGSRTLEGKGAGLLRDDIAALRAARGE